MVKIILCIIDVNLNLIIFYFGNGVSEVQDEHKKFMYVFGLSAFSNKDVLNFNRTYDTLCHG